MHINVLSACVEHDIRIIVETYWLYSFFQSLDCSKLFSLNSIYYDNPLQSRTPWNYAVGIGKWKCISVTRFACIHTACHIKTIESQLFKWTLLITLTTNDLYYLFIQDIMPLVASNVRLELLDNELPISPNCQEQSWCRAH